MADRCEVSVSYAIGLSEPLKVNVDCFGTEKKPLAEIIMYVAKHFDFTPENMIKELGLLQPIYKRTAVYGHFGRDEFPWEAKKTTKS